MHPRIRDASQFDIPALLTMLRQYRDAAPVGFLRDVDDESYMTHVLADVMAGKGLALVAETDRITGMLLAVISPSLWSPQRLVMTEMAYWVDPDARGSSAGHRLLSAYVEHGHALKEQGRISAYFISKMTSSPDLRFERFGFTKLEEFWVA